MLFPLCYISTSVRMSAWAARAGMILPVPPIGLETTSAFHFGILALPCLGSAIRCSAWVPKGQNRKGCCATHIMQQTMHTERRSVE